MERPAAGGRGAPGFAGGAAGAQHAVAAAHLSHAAQWESARLEAQARMAHAREAGRVRALAASASVPARRRRCPDTPPTSMLSFSENTPHASALEEYRAACAAARAAMPAYGLDSRPTSSMLSYSAARAAMPMQQANEEAARQDHHRELQQWGDHFIDSSYADCAAREFAAMLLDESLHEQQTEKEKEYWIGIMHLVNDSTASGSSSPQRSVAVPAARGEASSSSAPMMQTSVAMPAPQAYYSSPAAASSSTSVAAPAPDV